MRCKSGAAKSGCCSAASLREALGRFNPWLTADMVRQVIERLEALPPTIEGNREMLAWLRGERQWRDEGAKLYRRVRLIDFETPGANVLQVTWEWKIKPPARKGNRADVMFVVNGLPAAIVEHKNPKDRGAIERGAAQLRRYEKETPELMGAAQLFNVTHLLDYWYGVTWNVSRRFMARWKERPEESYRFAVQSFFEPTDFLRTLRDWILFYVEDGETRKSVLRQHQRRAVERIAERCAEPDKQRGLIWHTQGSGKTFTLLTAARLILERKERFENSTVVVVVDRTELEGQLKGWVDRLLGEMQQQDIPIWRARSKTELRELLKTDKRGLILSMIHKFEGLEANANTRKNVYVFIDEAHRSVAKNLGAYLMAALPKATIVGFTGTPIDETAQGKGTFKIFGADDERGYLDKYSIAESIDDETTLPIRHTMAPSDMTVPAEQLNEQFFALAEAEDVTDVDELNKVLERAVNLRTFLTADDRIEKVAAFAAAHFKQKVEPLGYKAFLVGVNREACAKYKRALDRHLPPEWTAAVYTENADDAVDRPLVAELQLSPEREADARLMFKKADENPKMLIVTDKLLTGYDAPLLYCLYLDKPMRDHVLLQAAARVNRPYADAEGNRKPLGLIVDFVGVLRELKKALRFDSADVSGVIEDLDLLLENFLGKIAVAEADYLHDDGGGSPDERLEKTVYGRFLDPEKREQFFEDYKELEALWEILSPAARASRSYYGLPTARRTLRGRAQRLRRPRRLRCRSRPQDAPAGAAQRRAERPRTADAQRDFRREDPGGAVRRAGLGRGQSVQPRARPAAGNRRRPGRGSRAAALEGARRAHPARPGGAQDDRPRSHEPLGRPRRGEGSGAQGHARQRTLAARVRRPMDAAGRSGSGASRHCRAGPGAGGGNAACAFSQRGRQQGRAAAAARRSLPAAARTAKGRPQPGRAHHPGETSRSGRGCRRLTNGARPSAPALPIGRGG